MNVSEKFKFVWWGTAGCASRTTYGYFMSMGVEDLYNHIHKDYCGEKVSFTHEQGFPKGTKNYKLICNVRNPYSLVVSSYLDILTEYKKNGEELDFFDYLKTQHFSKGNMESYGTFFLRQWVHFHKEPDFIIHMETMEDDLRKLPFFEHDEHMDDTINDTINYNLYKNGSPYDVYEGQFQKYKRFYTQEIADYVYERMIPYFTKFGYDKDSWI